MVISLDAANTGGSLSKSASPMPILEARVQLASSANRSEANRTGVRRGKAAAMGAGVGDGRARFQVAPSFGVCESNTAGGAGEVRCSEPRNASMRIKVAAQHRGPGPSRYTTPGRVE
jgi:hypothetical protein